MSDISISTMDLVSKIWGLVDFMLDMQFMIKFYAEGLKLQPHDISIRLIRMCGTFDFR